MRAFEALLSKLVDRPDAGETAQIWFFDEGDAARGTVSDLHQMYRHSDTPYPITVKRLRDSSFTVRPRPEVFSSRSIYPSLGTGSPWKIYQNSSLPTSTSTFGKNSEMGALRMAIVT